MASYKPFGPFPLNRDGAKLASGALAEFWKERSDDCVAGLCDAVGVYVFAVRAKKNKIAKPWYIGRTDKQSFKKRLIQQELHFRQVLEKAKNGQLEIFLIAMKSPGGKAFRKPTKAKIDSNDWLESMMIGSALSCNSELINASKVKHLKTLHVQGYMNSKQGNLNRASSELRKTMNLG